MAALVCKAMSDQKLGVAGFLKSSGFASRLSYELPIVYQPHFKKILSISSNMQQKATE
jgi:hypothetical protein